ncbi:MAG TPA: four helix bundle protein [Longimicrobium sp.]|nr:four helix bundle protein [Longimicrobium sp.]
MKITSHRDLVVWQRAMDLVVEVYRLSRRFPADERFRLTSQITRAAASVPANIAEGHARSTAREYARFVSVAKGSLMEVETFLMLAVRLGYLSDPEASPALAAVTQISKMLTRLRLRLLESAPRQVG